MYKRTFIPGIRLSRKGQTVLEFTVIFIIILGVMITMKNYVKRGVQGRWKMATDDFGDQYDPQSVNSSMLFATAANSTSTVTIANGTYNDGLQQELGQWTQRVDSSSSVETKTGSTQIGD